MEHACSRFGMTIPNPSEPLMWLPPIHFASQPVMVDGCGWPQDQKHIVIFLIFQEISADFKIVQIYSFFQYMLNYVECVTGGCMNNLGSQIITNYHKISGNGNSYHPSIQQKSVKKNKKILKKTLKNM